LKVPKELGGAEADPMLQMAVIEALSYIHPATGWCAMIGNGSNGLAAGYLPDAGIAQIFAHGQVPIMASSFFPAATAKVQEGGYLINGRWRFGSGIRHTDWVLAGAIVVREDDQDIHRQTNRPRLSKWPFPRLPQPFTTTGRSSG
ncbi:MAG: hypothetical protein KDE31_22620, partial [Caldilineaceae bacterium]|nr:hypothetical protein [Caldilineaceae bacterium]